MRHTGGILIGAHHDHGSGSLLNIDLRFEGKANHGRQGNTLADRYYQPSGLIVIYLFHRNSMHSRFITHVINADIMKNLQSFPVREFGLKLALAFITWALIVIAIFAEQ
jgi:hypothetical protein